MPDSTPNMADLGINPEVSTKLLPHLDSFVKWELLRLLHDNPDMAATLEDLARYMGRDETELKPAARALVCAGLCRQIGADPNHAFALTADQGIRQLVGHLVEGFTGDRLVRLAVSAHILRARRRASNLQSTSQSSA